MHNRRSKPWQCVRGARRTASGAALCLAAMPAVAQDAVPFTGRIAPDPNPYYLGVSQGFTHDTNVYRIPDGPGDNFSSTSVFGGFNQPISRQRVFGRAGVAVNRYFDESQLNNTSYDLSTGAELATIENISGGLNLGLSRNLAAPAAAAGVPTAVRNIAQTQHADLRVRWGGVSLLTLEGGVGYVRLDYSAPEYVSSESRETTGSLALYYRPGAFLRVGVGGRFERTRTPKAVLDPVTGDYQSNITNGRNLDLLADYAFSQILQSNARVSYTRQTNSSIAGADFSGLTGSLGVTWRPGAKTTVQLDAARDAGFEAASQTRYAAVQSGTGVILTPVSALYENNRVTNSFALGVSYAATAKIGAGARLHYTRANLVSAVGTAAGTTNDSTDVSKSASLSVSYEITRAWGASCSATHETREVSGAVVYSYRVNTLGCATQFTWR
jgi:hypothetical protein